jgi:hypothetical protein
MTDGTWRNLYKGLRLIYYTGLFGTNGLMLFIVVFLYYTIPWTNNYILLLLVIPSNLIMVFLVLRPLAEDARYKLVRTYNGVPFERVSASIQEALSENKIRFTTRNDFLFRTMPRMHYELYFDGRQDGLEIGINKSTDARNTVFVALRYRETTSRMLVDRVKDAIEARVMGQAPK